MTSLRKGVSEMASSIWEINGVVASTLEGIVENCLVQKSRRAMTKVWGV